MKMARDASAASRAFELSPSDAAKEAALSGASRGRVGRGHRASGGADRRRAYTRAETTEGFFGDTKRREADVGGPRGRRGRRGGQGGPEDRGAGKRKISPRRRRRRGGAPTPKRAAGARNRGTVRGTVAAVAHRAGMTMTTTNAAAVARRSAGRTVLVTGAAVAALTNPAAAATRATIQTHRGGRAGGAASRGAVCHRGGDVTPR